MKNKKTSLIFAAIAVTLLSACGINATCSTDSVDYDSYYVNLPFEIDKVTAPNIPAYEVNLSDFGGVGDGIALNTEAFSKAISHLAANGGGRLVIPDGVWLTGPIVLENKIDLHVSTGAILLFSNNKDLYPVAKTFFEGWETYRCQSPITAIGKTDIAFTGGGIIDGNGAAWRAVKFDKMAPGEWRTLINSGGVLSDDGKTWYPSESFAKGASNSDLNINRDAKTLEDFQKIRDYLRPVMIHIRDCERVLFKDLFVQNSPCWNIHPIMTKDIIVDGVTIRCPWYAQNGDGVDFESCDRVLMINSTLDVGDDAICIKSGKDEEGRRRGVPCSNIVVDNCTVFHGHGGFVVGSEMSGGAKNISVTNCRFSGTDVGLRFKSTRGRGGVVENIYISDVYMNDIKTEPILFDLFYGGKSASEALADGDGNKTTDMAFKPVDETTPEFRNITINNVVCHGARRAMLFNGLPEKNVNNIKVSNVAVYATVGAEINESTNVDMKNVEIYPEQGPALIINNSKRVKIDEFKCPANMGEAMRVTGSRNGDIKIKSESLNTKNVNANSDIKDKLGLDS